MSPARYLSRSTIQSNIMKNIKLSIATCALFTAILTPQVSLASIREPLSNREIPSTHIAQAAEAVQLWNSGNEKVRTGDYRGAMVDFDLAIAIDPNYAMPYNDRALLKDNQFNDFQGALADYNTAISLAPNDPVIYYNRGSLKERKLNDYRGALADYDRAIALNPDYADVYNNRAFLKRDRLNNRPGALSDFNTALSLYRQANNTEGVNRITTALSQTPRDGVQNFTMRNLTNTTIERVYISTSTDDDWGPDRLGRTQVIYSGESNDFDFTGFAECLFDIKVVFTDGGIGEKRNVNLCQISTFDVTD
jgi:tetratricopeptide (TPR) repeat protein